LANTDINFDAPASLRKYPSVNARRNPKALFANPYLLHLGSLDDCIKEFMSKPASRHTLCEIVTEPQPPLVTAVLGAEHIIELRGCGIFSDCGRPAAASDRRNEVSFPGLNGEAKDKSLLEQITDIVKKVVETASDAATQAMEPEPIKPPGDQVAFATTAPWPNQ
jgi:hypothetical protein